MPPEVEAEVQRSREFSKVIKKRCGGGIGGVIANNAQAANNISNDKKMKMEELLEMQREANEIYFVITPEMLTLNEYV